MSFPFQLCAGLLVLSSTLNAQTAASAELAKMLPRWLALRGEYRARYEAQEHSRFAQASDRFVISRIRLDIVLKPFSNLTVGAQLQDARIYGNSVVPSGPPNEDSVDFRLAWLELRPKKGWWIRAGRQEFSIGDQRLLGPANWRNASPSFDAVRLNYTGKRFSADVFTASLVVVRHHEWNHRIDGDNLHGAMVIIPALPRKSRLDALVLWRVGAAQSEGGVAGRLNFFTYDLRAMTDISPRTHLTTEIAFQAGRRSSDAFRAWAGHWRVARDLTSTLSARGVYDYSPGDEKPGDGRQQTFDPLYPTQHDRWGQVDQVGWRNTHHIAEELTWLCRKNIRLEGKHHTWWLASATDGLYSANGGLVARDPTGRSGRYVGQELDVLLHWAAPKGISSGIGVGHVFAGGFVQKTTPGRHPTFLYAYGTYSF